MSWINKLMKKILPAQLERDRKFENQTVVPKGEKTSKIDEDGKDENGEYELLEREILPEKIICPDCGGITLEGLEFCDKCGGELT